MSNPITNEELAQACEHADGRRMDYWLFREAAARLREVERVAKELDKTGWSPAPELAARLRGHGGGA